MDREEIRELKLPNKQIVAGMKWYSLCQMERRQAGSEDMKGNNMMP